MKTVKQVAPLLAAIVLLLAVFRIWVPQFLSLDNLLDLAQQISINAVLAFGMTLVILIGGIDLSVGAVVALIGTLTVWLLPRVGLGGAVSAGLVAATVFGAVNGICAARTAMPPFIITLATMLFARGLALRFNEGRPIAVPESQQAFLALGNARVLGIVPEPVMVMVAAFVVTAVLLHRTRFGQHLYAIGGNREAARYTGIPIARNVIAVYVACSLLAGIAGHDSRLPALLGRAWFGPELRAHRHRRGGRGRNQLRRRRRDHARNVPGSDHHWHSRQGAEPGGCSLFAPVHRPRARHPLRRLPRRPAPEPETMTWIASH